MATATAINWTELLSNPPRFKTTDNDYIEDLDTIKPSELRIQNGRWDKYQRDSVHEVINRKLWESRVAADERAIARMAA